MEPRAESPGVTLTCYLLDDSREFQSGRRRPAVVVLPGGSYLSTSDREAEPVALRWASLGYHCFVLRYSVGYPGPLLDGSSRTGAPNPGAVFPGPLADLAAALATIRSHSVEWLVDTERLVLCGFSAGGHLAAMLGTTWHDPATAVLTGVPTADLRVAALVLGYPVTDYEDCRAAVEASGDEVRRSHWREGNMALFGVGEPDPETLVRLSPSRLVTSAMPPAFLWHTAADALVPVSQSLLMSLALARAGVAQELHVFSDGPHGLALADAVTAGRAEQIEPRAAQWLTLAAGWLAGVLADVS